MKKVLLVIGYLLTFGAAINAILALIALYVVGMNGFAEPGLSVETFMHDHTPFLGWAKSAAEAILPQNVASFFFAAPALVVFPLRAIIAGLLGALALKAARRR
jgi:hypothetical protein